MKKQYISPEMQTVSVYPEPIMQVSEEAFDINVSFDTLWGIGNV